MAYVNTYRFSSKEWNDNAGLYYYLYRFYDPNLQRWPNHDPIEEKGGINLYKFIANNPENAVDSFGFCPSKQNGVPTYNGCGTGSFPGNLVPNNPFPGDIITFPFESSCNGHDICYGTCGSSKDSCDKAFLNNMLDVCSAYKYLPPLYVKCASLALIYYEAVHNFGGGPFKDAQKDACNNKCCNK
jgi:RHS repeat-associated protein